MSPELAPIETLLSAQSNRKYHEGFFMLLKDLNGSGQPAARQWEEVYAVLIGNELSYWDAELMKNGDHGFENKPNYLNFSDATFKALETLPTSEGSLSNVIVLSTTLKNRFLLQYSTKDQFRQWHAALRLASFEYTSLQEGYTAAMLSARGSMLSDIRVILAPTKFAREDWTGVRFGAGMPWKRCFTRIEPYKKQKKKKNQGKIGKIEFFESEKSKKPMATIVSAESVYAVYPKNFTIIDQSTMVKLDGMIEFDKAEGPKECSIFLMPEQHSSVPGYDTLIRFLIPVLDAFKLYGRPERLNADKTDPNSLLFALPVLPNVHYLEVQDLLQLSSSSSSLSWDAFKWNNAIKQILQTKMSDGYTGCGSVDGINAAVNFLDASKDVASGKLRSISTSNTDSRSLAVGSSMGKASPIATTFSSSKAPQITVQKSNYSPTAGSSKENLYPAEDKYEYGHTYNQGQPVAQPQLQPQPQSQTEPSPYESLYPSGEPTQSGSGIYQAPGQRQPRRHKDQTAAQGATPEVPFTQSDSSPERSIHHSHGSSPRRSPARSEQALYKPARLSPNRTDDDLSFTPPPEIASKSRGSGKIDSIYNNYAQIPTDDSEHSLNNILKNTSLSDTKNAKGPIEESDLYPREIKEHKLPPVPQAETPEMLTPNRNSTAADSTQSGTSDDSDFQVPVRTDKRILSPFTEFHQSFSKSMQANLYPTEHEDPLQKTRAQLQAKINQQQQQQQQQQSQHQHGRSADLQFLPKQRQQVAPVPQVSSNRTASGHNLERKPPQQENRAPSDNVRPQQVAYEHPHKNPYLGNTPTGYHTPVNQQNPPSRPPPLEQPRHLARDNQAPITPVFDQQGNVAQTGSPPVFYDAQQSPYRGQRTPQSQAQQRTPQSHTQRTPQTQYPPQQQQPTQKPAQQQQPMPNSRSYLPHTYAPPSDQYQYSADEFARAPQQQHQPQDNFLRSPYGKPQGVSPQQQPNSRGTSSIYDQTGYYEPPQQQQQHVRQQSPQQGRYVQQGQYPQGQYPQGQYGPPPRQQYQQPYNGSPQQGGRPYY